MNTLLTQDLFIKGENIDLEKIKSCINSLGYKYKGEIY